jgi:LPXTG-motif cell wall-anchored protein
MKRLAGTTAAYALIAALLVATPLSASEDPEAAPAAPHAATPDGAESAPPEDPQATGPGTASPEAAPPATAPPDAAQGPPSQQAAPPGPPPHDAASEAAVTTEPASAGGSASQPERGPGRGEPATADRRPRSARRPRATAAADTTVTISDFQFAPSAVTIDVGDTVTWRNEGPTPHSATSEDGSFDTGIYERGQRRSHTFDEAGTFAYFCTPHPNMRGTVTVRAASGGGSGGGGSGGGGGGGSGSGGGGSTAGGSTGAGASSSGSGGSSGAALPATGFDTGGLAALGLVTIALGAWLRRRASAAA